MKLLAVIVLILVVAWNATYADMNEAWKNAVEQIQSQEVIKMEVTDGRNVKTIDNSHFSGLTTRAVQVEALENPDTRSLPEVKGILVVFMKNYHTLVIQIVEQHWFKAVYLDSEGRVTTFILKDKGDSIFQFVDDNTN